MKTALTSIALVCAVSTLTAFAQDKEASKPAAPALVQGANGAAVNVPAADKAPVKETGAVTGKIVDSNKNPVKTTNVAIIVPAAPQTNAVVAGGAPVKRPPIVAHGASGDDGVFKIENVPVGKYIVSVHADKSMSPGHTKDPIEVKANETVDAGTITLQIRKPADATAAKAK